MPVEQLIFYAVRGYILTVLLETPVLIGGLSKRYTIKEKIFASIWLNACSYPLVSLVIPFFIDPFRERLLYLLVAETVAPASECCLFWFAFANGKACNRLAGSSSRDLVAVVLANLFSFGVGELLYKYNLLS